MHIIRRVLLIGLAGSLLWSSACSQSFLDQNKSDATNRHDFIISSMGDVGRLKTWQLCAGELSAMAEGLEGKAAARTAFPENHNVGTGHTDVKAENKQDLADATAFRRGAKVAQSAAIPCVNKDNPFADKAVSGIKSWEFANFDYTVETMQQSGFCPSVIREVIDQTQTSLLVPSPTSNQDPLTSVEWTRAFALAWLRAILPLSEHEHVPCEDTVTI